CGAVGCSSEAGAFSGAPSPGRNCVVGCPARRAWTAKRAVGGEGGGKMGGAGGVGELWGLRGLRGLTFNIWSRPRSWEHGIELIRAGLRQLSPDLVGLQEVVEIGGRSQADTLREGLGYEAAFGFVQEHAGGVRFGNAVLSRWPILESESLPLPMGVDKH